MQPLTAPDDGHADIAASIAASMQRMGVVGLPRNYEIFYEIFTGSNAELGEAFSALGPQPSQAALDQLANRFFTAGNRHAVVEEAHDEVVERTREIMALLIKERNSLEKFGVILDQTSDGLSGRYALSRELLQKIVGIMAAATETTLEQGRHIAKSMADKSAELEKMKSTLEEYKRLAETDPLTKVWNRRAFDKKLGEIYNDNKSVMFGALILADIDAFKAFNDRHGHPMGDRILQMVGRLLTASGGAGSFVARTGGEEFALVVEGLTEDATARVAEAARRAIARADVRAAPGVAACGPVTISLGVCMASEADSPDDLYAKADRALYASKVNGRDRVTLHSQLAAGKFKKNWLLYRSD